MKNDIIFISTCDWNGLWYQRQHLACQFAAHGHRVFYINRTLQRWPTLNHLRIRLLANHNQISEIELPSNIHTITPVVGIPVKEFRFINRLLLKRTIRSLHVHKPILISYLPTYNALDCIDLIKPELVVYVNEHNYSAMDVIPDLLKSEKKLVESADLIFADSEFNVQRLEDISHGRTIHRSLPGVYFDLFNKAKCFKNRSNSKILFYFGLIAPYLDINMYNQLSQKYDVIFMGKVSPGMKKNISARIKILNPVFNKTLPDHLELADVFALFYKQDDYINGVIPAKIFECLATQKPVIVTGLQEMERFNHILYNIKNSYEVAQQVIENLDKTETIEKINERKKIATNADWKNRYKHFSNIIFSTLKSKTEPNSQNLAFRN